MLLGKQWIWSYSEYTVIGKLQRASMYFSIGSLIPVLLETGYCLCVWILISLFPSKAFIPYHYFIAIIVFIVSIDIY